MGAYNTYAGIQMKLAEELTLKDFRVGDKVDIPNGVYVGHEGVVVVVKGMLVAKFEEVMTKWGDPVSPASILEEHDDVFQAVKNVVKKRKPG